MKIMFILFVFPMLVVAADFSDDFEAYSVGDDIASSSSWMNIISEGLFTVSAEGSNNVVLTDWNGYSNIVYLSDGGFADGSVTVDVKLSGSSAVFGVFARGQVASGVYTGGIIPIAPSIGASYIAYVPLSGEQVVLAQDYIYLAANTWYTVSLETIGSNPVNLAVSVNGTTTSSAQDNTYNLGNGFNGVVSSFESSEPLFTFDNYIVDDYSTSLSRVSFGGIKALFR